jgi:hypothetical protein
MGEARRRKLAGDKTFKGNDYRFDQWRFLQRMKKFIESKVRGK